MKQASCLINFAKGAWYPRGQARLCQSLYDVGFHKEGQLFAWSDEAALGCPPHEQQPYAFKIAAFAQARKAGFTTILWCDAAVWAIKPITPIFEHIEKFGHILFHSGFNCAQWTSDTCLESCAVTRDQAEKMPMYMACCMGLDLTQERPKKFLDDLTRICMDGKSLPGDWRNDHCQVSRDTRCQGHRHDQSVGSIVAAKLGMDITIAHETYFAYYMKGPYRYGAANDMSGIKDSVVMLSQGM